MIGAVKRLSGEAVPAGQCVAGTQADLEGLRRGNGIHATRLKDPTAPSASAARSMKPIRTATSTRISTTTRPTGKRISKPPGRRSSSRRRDGITHFRGGHGDQRHLHGRYAPAATRPAGSEVLFGPAIERFPRPRRAEAHADGDCARHLRRSAGRRQPLARNRGSVSHGAAAGAAKKGCWWAFRRAPTWPRALRLARELHREGRSAMIVTMLCDSADKYLSEHFWDEE